ncbi:MAG: glycosyltransferase family 4 protein [bacterium]
MRILLATNYQPPRENSGGVEFAALELRKCWEQDGHSVTWVSSDIPPGNPLAPPGSIRIPSANFLQERWSIDIPIINPLCLPRLSRAVRECDAVNCHSLAPGLSVVVMLLAIRHRKPTVVTQHVPLIDLSSRIVNRVQQFILCQLARFCTHHDALLTFVSGMVRDWFIKHARLSEKNLRITPVGINQDDYRFVDDDERRTFKAKWKVAADKFNVLFIGRFEEKKGLVLLKEIAERTPEVQFNLRGSGTIDVESWKLPNVALLPFVSNKELRELYGAHELLILPSFGEGWPAVVPQAMACGLASLISEEAFSGYGRDSEMFLVRKRTVDDFVGVLQLASKGGIPLLARRKTLSDYAMQTWDWQRTARIYVDLFRTLGAK